MTIKTKRIIASMILAVGLSITVVFGVFLNKYTDESSTLYAELNTKQSQLYDLLKNNPNCMHAYKTQVSQLQNDFLSGKITAQQYDKAVSELNKSNNFISEYSQNPEIQKTYSKEIAEIKDIEDQLDANSKKLLAYCLPTGLVGFGFLSAGYETLLSTITDEETIDKYCL